MNKESKNAFRETHINTILGIKGPKSKIMEVEHGVSVGGSHMPDVTYETPIGAISVSWRDNKFYGLQIALGDVTLNGVKIKVLDLPNISKYLKDGEYTGRPDKFADYIYDLSEGDTR